MPEIQVETDPQDQPTSPTVDLLEDYWYDFLIFRKEAVLSRRNGDLLRTHRYLRASLFTFLNYLTSLANRWLEAPARPADPREPDSFLMDRLARLSGQFSGPPPEADIRFLTSLASRCMDLHRSDEVGLFQALSFDEVDAAESRILTWINDFVPETGLTFHSDMRSLPLPPAPSLGAFTKDDFQEPGAIGGDPYDFGDDPRIWGDPGPVLDDHRSAG